MTVVDGDTATGQTSSRIPHLRVVDVHNVGHVEWAMFGRGLVTELLEVDVASGGHKDQEHRPLGSEDERSVPDLSAGYQEVIARAENITGQVVDLDTVSRDHGQLGLRARQPDWLDDVVGSLKLGLEDELVGHASIRVERQDMTLLYK